MNILGISAFYHDSAACFIRDGKIVSAAQEERFTRKKHDHGFPVHAIAYCLKEAGIEKQDLDYVAFYDKPFQKFDRLLSTYLTYAPRGFASFIKAMPLWLKQKLWIKDFIADELKFDGIILFPEHHQSHAASAFFPSPFKDAAFLTVDGVGEWTTSSYGLGQDNKIHILGELHFPHSLGLLYSAFTYFTGFRVNSGEYKLMGLAPYGNPRYVDIIKEKLIDLKDDGSFKMNMKYFNFAAGLTMTNKKFAALFNGPARKPESDISQREMDIARSIQEVSEEILLKMVRHVHKQTNKSNLVLAGGVALNCVGNGRILREGPFDNIWIQPAAGDAGGALGAALFTWHQYLDQAREPQSQRDSQQGSYLGPGFSDDAVKSYLDSKNIPYHHHEDQILFATVAQLIADEKVIGWFQGRMEFGPRALGNRSIIGDARSTKMQSTMNLKIKYRESFRPFAPSILCEKVSDIFELEEESPYMLLVAPVKKELWKDSDESQSGLAMINSPRSTVPAITHVDQSARIQTVNPDDNPRYHALISQFYELTGSPVIINTSFNVRGEPIVCTPEEAYTCFMRTEMDHLVLGNYLLNKSEQPVLADDVDWKRQYELD
ncbi:MAG: carbamoyltransferase [FCB group bacterium]|nr:carbamoyltransferase [FCB group bacterium]MBL7028187.1 carbamoyltransferase [Candidatus Neomarinimicrobiota bacterium]MBL7122507.1 carbamoyltransferase [Candidatus Neomarinimicrobiota bacterium]